MQWLSDIKQILYREPESYLAYFYGRLINQLPHLTQQPPVYRGLLPRLLIFFRFVIVNTRLRRQPSNNDSEVKFFFFAGSHNQMETMLPVIHALEQKSVSLVSTATANLVGTGKRYDRYRKSFFSVGDALKSFWLLAIRGWALYKQLKAINPLLPGWYFNKFCYSYIYLIYFYALLRELQPEFVITANDHSVQNRCMLAVANYLNIKTVYLQHASVSNLFPALRVNYAFLDGQSALETYRACEKNLPEMGDLGPRPQIFLSGQKKQLLHNEVNEGRIVGIAVNKLDDIEQCLRVCIRLIEAEYRIKVRWHPRQETEDINSILKKLRGHPLVELHDPKQSQVGDFFSGLGVLIAGNSSIHLEAALSAIKPVYYEFSNSGIQSDYYSYVASGVAEKADTVDEIVAVIEGVMAGENAVDLLAVKYFSHSYGTEWFGREGGLVADSLLKLSTGLPAKNLFGYASFSEK